ncbi:hypothetical protein [Polaribacter sp. Z014]|uniref:hypothetical protein n=1 Tax=Polaribacter sp. Z014 TaxID=2927126 RepID=UPI0020224ABD|nr:hypothetical protein [Polaribacter sp. Z014]
MCRRCFYFIESIKYFTIYKLTRLNFLPCYYTNKVTLAIFDLLKEGKEFTTKELKEVKKVADKTLDILKREKPKVKNWRESRQVKAQVKSTIYDNLEYVTRTFLEC